MGRYLYKLPDIGEGIAEAEIVGWHVKPGDKVEEDQPLVDVMTDKATVEMTSPVTGTVLSIEAGAAGEMAAVGSVLLVLDVEGAGHAAQTPAPVPVQDRAPAKPVVTPAKASAPQPAKRGGDDAAAVTVLPFVARVKDTRPLASPAVRKRAHELGIALQYVPGHGPAGRIRHEDLDAYVQAQGASPPVGLGAARAAPRAEVEDVKLIGLRRKIAEKMQLSKRHIPHFGYVEEVDVTELEELRQHLNATRRTDQPKLTILPFVIRAVVQVLPDFPQINAIFDDEAGVLHRHAGVHVGIAAQTPNGLLVPVLRHAEACDLWQCAAQIARLAQAARDGKAAPAELAGSTITVTSLGPLGGIAATPVINYPEVAIIGPNRIVERPVVRQGQIVVRKMMNLSSSFDHRIVDGHDAASFIQEVKALLERPAMLFIERT